MADSNFWRDLAEQFRALDASGSIWAEWTAKPEERDSWRVVGIGEASRSVRLRFISLATRGGNKLNSDPHLESVDAWLSALKYDCPDSTVPAPGGGQITRLCEASADLCNIFESATLEMEHQSELEERRRLDATGKNEPIPGPLAREVLGQLYGIKPQGATRDRGEPNQPRSSETIGAQLSRLREECRWTVEQLAEMIARDATTVYRHLSGTMIPGPRTRAAYERVFSKQLARKVVIEKTPVKRQ